VSLLNGDSEEEVFGSEAPPPPQLPMPPATPERTGEGAKQLFPRPGYAGGTAE
jgi:cell division protease FtsH